MYVDLLRKDKMAAENTKDALSCLVYQTKITDKKKYSFQAVT